MAYTHARTHKRGAAQHSPPEDAAGRREGIAEEVRELGPEQDGQYAGHPSPERVARDDEAEILHGEKGSQTAHM